MKTRPNHTFTRNHQYQYDVQGRLTEHKLTDYQNQTGITEVFAFDPASNRMPVSAAVSTDKTKAQENSNSDNNDNHRKSTKSGRPTSLKTHDKYITYTYDTHGRLLYKTTEPVGQDNKPLKQSRNSLLAHRQALQLQYNANNELEKSLRT